jgi:hypothetical protein
VSISINNNLHTQSYTPAKKGGKATSGFSLPDVKDTSALEESTPQDSYINATRNRNKVKIGEPFKDWVTEGVDSIDNKGVTSSSNAMLSGDMVLGYPPSLIRGLYNSTVSEKSKDEMSIDEYKQWVMNEISRMPVSSWVRSSFSSGLIVITEKAFERMKVDPEWEKYVLNRVRSAYSVNGLPVGPNHVGYDVIGASPEECYGYAGPIGNNSSKTVNNEDSWWQKRHEKMEELIKEQTEKEQRERIAWQNQQKVFNLLNSNLRKENISNENVIVQSIMASTIASYENNGGG